ncbi:MAG TPA: hypothetical protein VGI81_26975 [Tepidisphaeraceae bacterium]|jgi:hypothetical protein
MNRREFLQQAGFAAGAIVAGGSAQPLVRAADVGGRCVIVRDPSDRIATQPPVEWAITRLRDALAGRDVSVATAADFDQAPPAPHGIMVAGRTNDAAAKLAAAAGVGLADSPESLAVAPVKGAAGSRSLVIGSDARGLSFALTDLADAVALGDEPLAALTPNRITIEHPANRVRGIGRLFCSDLEDKPWYNDRGFWRRYLDLLASQRFNRFHLALGLGYDFARGVKDSYFYFPYPFLLAVPGHQVRAAGLPDAERDNNLVMLRFIGDECAARGIDFQLGLWCHQYQFADSPDVNYRIEGLTGGNHASYCRDALAALLKACPNVAGVTFRIHGESGIAEGSYDFWKTVFEGVVRCGRKVPIEMHAKGSDQTIIDIALATGMPVTMAPKFCAEHMGLPYCQASIRPTELPHPGREDQGFFAKSSGTRSFLRYGYGDLLAEDRRYDVVHRMWPGTQRVLLWGDPVFAAAFGRTSGFCGSAGCELFEPMSFKGRMGSGRPGGRQGYADDSLKTAADFEKYRYWYVLWGRLLYNSDADPQIWQRVLRHEYGKAAAPAVEQALASAGRILPMVTTANSQSASYNAYWVEMSYNMPIVDPARRHPYADTPSPKRFGTVSPLDPQLFARVDDFAEQALRGERSGKYTPAEVASWLEHLARTAGEQLSAAAKLAGADQTKPAFRRAALDVQIQAAMGTFFSQKLRSAMLWALFSRTGDAAAATAAIDRYRAARGAWAEAAEKANGVYAADITYGPSYFHRGHWLDRLSAIDADIADMETHAQHKPESEQTPVAGAKVAAAIAAVLTPPPRPDLTAEHQPPPPFERRQAIELALRLPNARASAPAPLLHYRRVNQADAWQRCEMVAQGAQQYRTTIPADYTDSRFPLQYYFELRDSAGASRLSPGFNADWSNPPYYVIRQSRAARRP